MEKTKTGCLLIPNKVFNDDRGFFTEVYKGTMLGDLIPPIKQVNLSYSRSNVVRGMHFQTKKPQGKFIRVLDGEVVNYVMDLRRGSPTFSDGESFVLKPDGNSLYIPPGFANGFWVIRSCFYLYQCTEEYDPSSDAGINPLDPAICAPWTGKNRIRVSDKDKGLPTYFDFAFSNPFKFGVNGV